MKFGTHWLSDYVSLDGLSTAELSASLTMAGLEVEAIERACPDWKGIVVGEVVRVDAHPQADKLKICVVRDGSDDPKTVVCGAANVRVGLKVPFATVGAVLPNGTVIKKAQLRGQDSFGMLCSAKELGVSVAQEGLWELDGDCIAGCDLSSALNAQESVITINATPNRPDVLSLQGVAREVAALNQRPLKVAGIKALSAQHADVVAVHLDSPAACPIFVSRVITGLNPHARTPLWMQERLRRAGLRSLGPLVDVTNYVMLALGQPMHAYDRRRIHGAIRVRMAHADESLTLLDGSAIELQPDMLVISDDQGAIGLAGVMGGERSAIAEDTTDVLLEAAWFNPEAVAGRGRRLGIITDASLRFERGVDPKLCEIAVEWASQLLVDMAGGAVGPTQVTGRVETTSPSISVRFSAIERVLAAKIDESEVTSILARLGLNPQPIEGGVRVAVPSYRFDLKIEADLIEEVARVYGFNRIPDLDTPGLSTPKACPEGVIDAHRLLMRLIDRGYQEVLNYTFLSPQWQQQILGDAESINIGNPISNDLSQMRQSLIPGLLLNLRDNVNRQIHRLRIVELGAVFSSENGQVRERDCIAALHYGPWLCEQWGEKSRPVDFYDLKADVEALLAASGQGHDVVWEKPTRDFLHPTRSAQIRRGDKILGFIGELHPKLLKKIDLSISPVFMELAVDGLVDAALPHGVSPSKQPSVRRDIALIVDDAVEFAAVERVVRKNADENFKELVLFDVYRGQGIEKGRKSLAIGLILQDKSRTLADTEVDAIIMKIKAKLSDEVGAAFRE